MDCLDILDLVGRGWDISLSTFVSVCKITVIAISKFFISAPESDKVLVAIVQSLLLLGRALNFLIGLKVDGILD